MRCGTGAGVRTLSPKKTLKPETLNAKPLLRQLAKTQNGLWAPRSGTISARVRSDANGRQASPECNRYICWWVHGRGLARRQRAPLLLWKWGGTQQQAMLSGGARGLNPPRSTRR
jgi:hypothetical protein